VCVIRIGGTLLAMMRFQVWTVRGNTKYDEHHSFTINPDTGVLTIHRPDRSELYFSSGAWHSIEDLSDTDELRGKVR
jgi:hypothetical protein